jgi:hypothetical protein
MDDPYVRIWKYNFLIYFKTLCLPSGLNRRGEKAGLSE